MHKAQQQTRNCGWKRHSIHKQLMERQGVAIHAMGNSMKQWTSVRSQGLTTYLPLAGLNLAVQLRLVLNASQVL